jgi:hypothetical protein
VEMESTEEDQPVVFQLARIIHERFCRNRLPVHVARRQAASHLAALPSPRDEGNVGLAPRKMRA